MSNMELKDDCSLFLQTLLGYIQAIWQGWKRIMWTFIALLQTAVESRPAALQPVN